jgi:hypothetical protein
MKKVLKIYIKDILPDLSEEELEREAHKLEVMLIDRLVELKGRNNNQ